MKHIEKTIKLLLTLSLLIVVLVGFNSCNIDEPVPTPTPKTMQEYKLMLRDFYNREKLFVDSSKVGYNINEFAPSAATSFDAYKANYLRNLKSIDSILVKADSIVQKLPVVTIGDLVKAAGYTSTTGKAFRSKVNICDKRALNDSITSCLNLNNIIVAGNGGLVGVSNVLNEDKSKFLDAISLAITTRDASTTIDRQVKEALPLLNTARLAFLSSVIPSDLPTFINNTSASIASQLTIANNSVVGFNSGEYLSKLKANYLTALNVAQTAVVSGASFTQVSTVLNSLTTPKAAFIANVADKRTLNDTIIADSLVNTKLTVGTTNGQISLAVQNNFKSALSTALATRDNANSSDAQVKGGTYALTLYKNAVVASIPLHYGINTAVALNTATLVGTTTGKVPQAAKTAFTTAITTATTQRDAKTTTVTQMNDALIQLEKARVLFTAFIVK